MADRPSMPCLLFDYGGTLDGAGVLLGKAPDGTTYVLDVKRLRGSPHQVEQAVRQVAELDGRGTATWMEQEPGSAGAAVVDHYARRVLAGFNFRAERSTGDKATRAQPLAAAVDGSKFMEIAGTIAGDDTVLIITPNKKTRESLQKKIEALVK